MKNPRVLEIPAHEVAHEVSLIVSDDHWYNICSRHCIKTVECSLERWLLFCSLPGCCGVNAYPLVNQHFAMENHHAINGKIHYFYGHFPLLCCFGLKWQPHDVVISSHGRATRAFRVFQTADPEDLRNTRPPEHFHHIYPLVMTNIAIENCHL